MTETALRLGLGQPTVSHHLQRLQAETGVLLVTPVGRRLHLTQEGRHLARRGAGIIAALDQAEREIRAMAAMETGVLRLAAFPSAVATLVPALLDELAVHAPGLSVDITDAEPAEAAALVRSSDADFALTFSYPNGPTEDDLDRVALGQDPLFLVTSASPGTLPAPGERGAAIGVAELARYREETWIAGCPRCRGHLLAACAEAGFSPTLGFASDDYLAVQALVAAHRGVTLLPGLALKAHANAGVARFPVVSQARTIYACTLGRPPHSPAVSLGLQAAVAIGERMLTRPTSDARGGSDQA